MTSAPFVIGTDTGGTFTDTVIVAADGSSVVGKALTTHGALRDGVLASISAAAAAIGLTRVELLRETRLLAHGTTVGLNALLTGSGARVGLLTTAGFESALPIARSNKVHGLPESEITDALKWRKPELLVPRRRIAGVVERIDKDGDIVTPLDETSARIAIRGLLAQDVETIAVALLWSPVNDAHERRLAQIIAEEAPSLPVTLSSAVAPKIGEYERTATAVLNAYIAPLVADYLQQLEAALQAEGFAGQFLVMTMGGGVRLAQTIAAAPIHLLQSGPVGGITATRALGQRLGHDQIIATDVGGTSFDVGLIVDGELPRAHKPRIERHGVAVPVIDIASIGTGGGSIAHVDEALGALRVGPRSAGSMPGPACYGRGGTEPTLTDAAVVLGHVDRLGGAIRLDRDAARAAIAPLAARLDLSVEQTAEGIIDVACAQMADLVRRATIQRGHDPRRFTLYGYGGAAPQYVGRYAADLGVAGVVIPKLGPAFSAWGAVCSDLAALREQDVPPRPFRLPLDGVDALLDRLEEGALEEFAGLDGSPVVERRVGLRFTHQIHRIEVAVPARALDQAALDAAEADFRRRYERIIGRGASGSAAGVELVSISAEARLPAPRLLAGTAASGATDNAAGSRRAWFGGREQDVPVHRLAALPPGQTVPGPAFLESDQTTVVVQPGLQVEMNAAGDLLMRSQAADKVVPIRAGVAA